MLPRSPIAEGRVEALGVEVGGRDLILLRERSPPGIEEGPVQRIDLGVGVHPVGAAGVGAWNEFMSSFHPHAVRR